MMDFTLLADPPPFPSLAICYYRVYNLVCRTDIGPVAACAPDVLIYAIGGATSRYLSIIRSLSYSSKNCRSFASA